MTAPVFQHKEDVVIIERPEFPGYPLRIHRIIVPGGWIYDMGPAGGVFVPNPTEKSNV